MEWGEWVRPLRLTAGSDGNRGQDRVTGREGDAVEAVRGGTLGGVGRLPWLWQCRAGGELGKTPKASF